MALRFLIPSLLLVSLLVDVTLRFVPPGMGYFRAWEAASLFATADGSFAPNFHYDNTHSYGDLANFGNLPRFRQYHREVFTTDEFGFRNSANASSGEMPAAIVVGDSYAVGSGVSDGDTLSAQLMSCLSGRRVYNGAGDHPSWKMSSKLIQRLHMRGGLVIWEVSERSRLPRSVAFETPHLPGRTARNAQPSSEAYRLWQSVNHWTDSHLAYSPLRSYLTRSYRKVENGAWLPNTPAKSVLVGQLRNGDSMLFLDSEVDNFYKPQYDNGAYLAEINDLVHAGGNDLIVLLVPDKYGVYYPLLNEEGQSAPVGESHLDHLERELHRLGVPVVNLMGPLRAQAAAGLQTRDYNYAIDDTHWNRVGIQTAAREILRAWSNRAGSVSDVPVRPPASPTLR